MRPRTLRQALDQIQEMLSGKSYSMDLWNVLTALRGPDSRNRKIKYATTALIRSAAFPKRPCEDLSVFGDDSSILAKRRRELFSKWKDQNHFREHVQYAFYSLGLQIGGVNRGKNNRPHLGRQR